MKKLVLLILLLSITPAAAQNPTCPTRLFGDNSNACASTAFVQNAIAPLKVLVSTHIFVGNSSNIATDYGTSATFSPTGTFTLIPTAGTGNGLVISPQVLSGAATLNQIYSNIINITDSADWTGVSPTAADQANRGLYIQYNKAGGKGGVIGFSSNVSLSVATSNVTNTNKVYLGGFFTSVAGVNDGGSDLTTNAKGEFFGLNYAARALSGATFLVGLIGSELDISSDLGSTAANTVGLRIAHLTTHRVAGTISDDALQLTDQSGATGWTYGIAFRDNGGLPYQAPLKTTGTAIATVGAQTFAAGMDFSSATITNFLLGPGSLFTVTGAGAVKGVTYAIGSNIILAISGTDLLIADPNTSHINQTLGIATNFYDNTTHVFRSRAGATYVTINAAGATVAAGLNLSLTAGALGATNVSAGTLNSSATAGDISAARSTTAGVYWFGSTGSNYISSNGTTLSVSPLANSAAASAVCYTSGTTALSYNSGVTTCLASLLAVKNLGDKLTSKEGLEIVLAQQPWKYTMKEGLPTYVPGPQIGFVADYTKDERLLARNFDGTLGGFRYEQFTAALAGAVQNHEQRLQKLEKRRMRR